MKERGNDEREIKKREGEDEERRQQKGKERKG